MCYQHMATDNNIATLKMIKDDDEDDNLETALDVVATHIKKECSMEDYTHQTYHTNASKEIAEECAQDILQQLLKNVHWSTISSLFPN